MYERYATSNQMLCSYVCRRQARFAPSEQPEDPRGGKLSLLGIPVLQELKVTCCCSNLVIRPSTVSVPARGEHDGQWSDIWGLSSEAERSVMCGV